MRHKESSPLETNGRKKGMLAKSARKLIEKRHRLAGPAAVGLFIFAGLDIAHLATTAPGTIVQTIDHIKRQDHQKTSAENLISQGVSELTSDQIPWINSLPNRLKVDLTLAVLLYPTIMTIVNLNPGANKKNPDKPIPEDQTSTKLGNRPARRPKRREL